MTLFPQSFVDLQLSDPWLKISLQSSLNVIYCLIFTAWQWLMSFTYTTCIPMQIKPRKACEGKGQLLSSFDSGCAIPFPPRDLVIYVNLSCLSHNATDTACQWLCHLSILITSVLNSASDRLLISIFLVPFLEFWPVLSFGSCFFVSSFWQPPCGCFYVLGRAALTLCLGGVA